MRQRILCLLRRHQHSSFTKFIFFLYYSHIIRVAIAGITPRNGLEKTIGFGGQNAFTDQGDAYLLNSAAEVEIASSVNADLEENFAFLPEYNPPLKIMPLGDSITYGVIGNNDRDSGGYRTELWHKFVAGGLKVEFVGSQSSGPDSLGNKAHEGHCRWTIGQIAASVNEWLYIYQPDLILLMIGTNDTKKNSIKTMIDELSALIDQIVAHSPKTRLLIASIPPIHLDGKRVLPVLRAIYFNAAIPSIVDSKVAQGKKVSFVDMRSLTVNDLTATLSLDLDNGFHPNAQGYRKIANFWHDAILKVTSNQQTKSASGLPRLPARRFLPWRLARWRS